MGKIQKATRLPKDEADRVAEYADEREISEADALRRLIRAGLEAEQNTGFSVGQAGTILDVLQTALLVVLIVLVAGVM